MTSDEPRIRASFLSDTQSQLLCLQDALGTGKGRAMVHALQAVSEARGLAQAAHEGGIEAAALTALLGRTPADDDPTLLAVMTRLIVQLSHSQRKNRRRQE